MEHFLDEKIVMKFYLEQMADDKIIFLKEKEELKASIEKDIRALVDEEKMNNKIQIAIGLWKKLFEGAMSYISTNKHGYDKLFDYFDAYVEFEELIFASDSFYRDHTLHCLWVYFLGEYVKRNQEFDIVFEASKDLVKALNSLNGITDKLEIFSEIDRQRLEYTIIQLQGTWKLDEAARCISALTHDLGYPLKKIEKINKSMKKVLPYYGINNFDDFSFEYGNIQQEFVSEFIDMLSRDLNVTFDGIEKKGISEVFEKVLNFNKKGNLISVKEGALDLITEEDLAITRGAMKLDVRFIPSYKNKMAFLNDFESYQHGIMSAFVLMKNLLAFQDIQYSKSNDFISVYDALGRRLVLASILRSITNHTNEAFKISSIDEDTFLTFIDELEEFSRISRASQNREYVEEFCDSAIYMEDGWFNVVFEFNNEELDNLDPERAFKGRCKRFLTLFDIPHLDDNLKIRVTVVGKLPTNQNTYVLEIATKYAKIMINGEEINIPKYLKSPQYSSREEYQAM